MDVKMAFFYGTVKENIFIKQPAGYTDGISKVCMLKKALYGLKQSSQIWYNTLAGFLMSQGMKAINANLSVFAKKRLIIAIYVDDLLLTGLSLDEINKAKQALSKRFHMSDLGLCTYYLEMTISQDHLHCILRLSQRGYLEKILCDHQMWECKPVTSMDDHNHLLKAADGYYASEDFWL